MFDGERLRKILYPGNPKLFASDLGGGGKVRWGKFGNGVTSEILIFVQHQSARQRDIMFYLG